MNKTAVVIAFATFAIVPSFNAQTLTNGLVGYWPFTGNANDASGNHLDGNPGTALLVADRFGAPQSAYFFNGTNSFITFGKTPTTNVDNISMFCWIKPTRLPQWGIAMTLGYADGNLPCNGYGLGIGTGATAPNSHLTAENACIKWVDSGVLLTSTEHWDHVGLVLQNGIDYFYVNGHLAAYQQVGTPSPPTDFCIGTLLGSDQLNAIFTGYIDEVRVYDRALAPSDVNELYASEAPPVLSVHKAVYVDSSNLRVGTNYRLQVSMDLSGWTNTGSVFTATNSSWRSANYWDVEAWEQIFFRMQIAP